MAYLDRRAVPAQVTIRFANTAAAARALAEVAQAFQTDIQSFEWGVLRQNGFSPTGDIVESPFAGARVTLTAGSMPRFIQALERSNAKSRWMRDYEEGSTRSYGGTTGNYYWRPGDDRIPVANWRDPRRVSFGQGQFEDPGYNPNTINALKPKVYAVKHTVGARESWGWAWVGGAVLIALAYFTWQFMRQKKEGGESEGSPALDEKELAQEAWSEASTAALAGDIGSGI